MEKCKQVESIKAASDDNNAGVYTNKSGQKEHKPVDIFDLTISGQLPYTNEHPLFHNEVFFEKLLEYYQKQEAYEMCSLLINSKKV